MDEKEAIKRIKSSLRAGKSRAQILKGFQQRGYKLEYADELLRKAEAPRKVFAVLFLIFLAVLTTTLFVYALNKTEKGAKPKITGYSTAVPKPLENKRETSPKTRALPQKKPTKPIQNQISPDFITAVLNNIGVQNYLKSNPFFGEPIINFRAGEQTFHSVIGNKITTKQGLSKSADIQFNADSKTVKEIMGSQNPMERISQFIRSGKITIEKIASDIELFSKGYKDLKDSLEE